MCRISSWQWAAVAAIMAGMAGGACAQSSTFTGFTSGNLVVSRSVYVGDANTVVVGQSLPPTCPASAEAAKSGQCSGGKATANGTYPNVWTNAAVDGSFGVTSPIFLDQLNPATGAVINTLPIPPSMVTTSFSSKSELAVNLSTDGTALTFVGYVAPPNTIDVSNSRPAYTTPRIPPAEVTTALWSRSQRTAPSR